MHQVLLSLHFLFKLLFSHRSLVIIVENLLFLSIEFLQMCFHEILLLLLLISHHSFLLFLTYLFKAPHELLVNNICL